jgi:ankyrin repeat protein
MVQGLIELGADVHARNRRGAEPLHAAAIGRPGDPGFDPKAQTATIARLIAAGADPNAIDISGVTALHRAVRTRSATAVKALIDRGADVARKTKNGSTALRLATLTTGRSGSGSPEAKAQQERILSVLAAHGSR